MYTASDELANLLLKNGAKDNSLHRNRNRPLNAKREFSFGKRHYIVFDYQDIQIFTPGQTETTCCLSEEQVKSILAYYTLPYNSRSTFDSTGRSILDFSKYCNSIKEDWDNIRPRTFEFNIVRSFESVKI